MRKRSFAVFTLAFFLAATAVGGCGKKPADQEAAAAKVAVEVGRVTRGNIAQPARVTGTVQAGTTVNVTAATPGKLKSVRGICVVADFLEGPDIILQKQPCNQ
ncbi:MAG: HlyD family secretion protein [Moorella sp. (in: firmicutes)]|nr:HlyD family secretion protein [Moorella sp. (in: firmicutes)]